MPTSAAASHVSRLVLPLILLVATFAVSACGDDGSTERTPQPGSGVNRTIALDLTTAESGDAIAERHRQAARRHAEDVLTAGGHLRIVVFAGAGVAAVPLIDEDVPVLSGNARKRYLMSARANVDALVGQALGLVAPPADSTLPARMESMGADGSDIAGIVDHEVELLRRRGGGRLEVLSDGLQRDEALDLSAVIGSMTADEVAKALAERMPGRADGVEVGMSGLGISGNDENVTTERARKLTGAWDAACRTTGALACEAQSAI